MRGQILSFDLMMSVVGFILIVGTVILILNASNLSSIYDYEMFKMSFHDASRELFSSDPVVGILDDRGMLRENPQSQNNINLKLGSLSMRHRLNLSLYVVYQHGNQYQYGDDCRGSNQSLSITRVLFYRDYEYYSLTLVGCRIK
ncbi:MAG: hypothetical protein NZ908_00195 [Candidatus Micrarchaeota archaeon]|nr:hypothetical protein [Candidatus Micrarchaeota archaeon]MCX8154214.1 hypothetical protein [Candidatus Micrarchaeota archaeon]